jgi:hypothetical protein
MKRYFGFENTPRNNPHFTLTDNEIGMVGNADKFRIAKGIADLEEKVWGRIAPQFIQGVSSYMGILSFSSEVIVGVSYENESDIFGPYLSYFIASEKDPNRTWWGDFYQSSTGQDFLDFMRDLPSDNPRFFQRDDQTRDDTALAKREHKKLMDDLYDYMEDNGIAFGTFARFDTTYQLMKSGKQGRMVIVAEKLIPEFFGPNDDCVQLIGYYVPKGEYRENMIESTRM